MTGRFQIRVSGEDGYAHRIVDTETDNWDAVALTIDQGEDADGELIGDHGMGRRIVAALNDVTGIPTASLEKQAVHGMHAALQFCDEVFRAARKYFPTSIRSPDRFMLENACATVGKALDSLKEPEEPEPEPAPAADSTTNPVARITLRPTQIEGQANGAYLRRSFGKLQDSANEVLGEVVDFCLEHGCHTFQVEMADTDLPTEG